MPTPREVSALRSNVLGAFDDYSRLTFLGERAQQFPDFQGLGPGFTLEDKGAVFLNAMLNEFFSVAPDKETYKAVLGRANNFVDRETKLGGRAWRLVREHLLEIGRQRGWSTVDTMWTDWTPEQQKTFTNMVQSETPKRSGGCYVATAVYGSYDCPDVWVLRRFRDQTLMNTVMGRALVRVYYATSPFAVRRGGFVLRHLARRPLNIVVRRLRTQGVSDSPYDDSPRQP
ncbi:MAG: hypothetical protein KC492_35125 [Myxococcales bacterium]|nr:hypothetical protein [Myxococcales bacterium]